MLNTMKKWIAPPVFQGDEEKTGRAGLLNLVILISLFITSLTFFALFLRTGIPIKTLIIVFLWLLVLLAGRAWLHSGRLGSVELILGTVFFVAITATNISQGSVRSTTTSFYIFWVALVAILYGLPGLLIGTSLSSLAVMCLIWAEHAGLLPKANLGVGVSQWMIFTALFALNAGLAYYTNQLTRRTLMRAQNEIEQRKLTEMELRKLTRAVEQSPASIVITDLDGKIEYVNPRFSSVTGYSLDEAIGKNPRILKSGETPPDTHRQLWDSLTAGQEWQGEFVNRKKDGSLYYESAVVSPVTNPGGVVTHYLAVKEDITERKRSDESLRISEARHRLMADNARDVIWTMAPDGAITYVSPAFEAMRGFTPAEAMLQTTEEILTPASQAVSLGYFAQLHADLVAGRPPQSFREELEYRCKDGSTVWTEVLAIPLLSNGGLVEVLGVTRDISEHKRLVRELHQAKDATEAANRALLQANEDLARMATTDPLTGIWNRRHFELVADAEAAQARRYERPLSLLIFDIDHFKSINDHFGHQTGDQVLLELTELVGQALRDADVLARWGGEEFVVIMPHCGAQEALLLAEKLRALVAGHPFSEVGTVTVSLGAAQYKCDETLDDWFKRIDLALYEAKSGGRNTVRLGS